MPPSSVSISSPAPPISKSHLRIARPTNDISAILPFYTEGLGFTILSSFTAHAGFDGVMLGHPGAPYHLEITTKDGHDAGRAPTQDNLLVFYIPDETEWKEAVTRMKKAGFGAVTSFNPYWDVQGKTFEDPDGWRMVLQNAAWDI
ncbi:prolyl endopeptidase [Lophium mytilinum]|uniref:Prolyl endopeptidase n=1 Tax=Lophium mytilinum TaxID=390894 RepID=A0A6A6QU77_9PEZI|nr:prolyl endopeptidase [Lophium mytilinum]